MIRIENLNVEFGNFRLKDINLHIKEGSFFILLGPTGAGKTVLLEAIAGLIPIKTGNILIGNTDVTHLPPEKRGVSIVYQDQSLFPHLSVIKNIRYGVKYLKVNRYGREHVSWQKIDFLIELLNLSNILHRYPDTLSGGERQRVALARALAVNPKILLLDEPISALDPVFREEVKASLKKLHTTAKVTFMMVTHDFADALSLGDKAVVINNGVIEQEGSIKSIFNTPKSKFVADFVGVKNIFLVKYRGTKALMGGLAVETGRNHNYSKGYIAVRPEDIVISKNPIKSSMKNIYFGKVKVIINQGFFYEVHVLVDNFIFKSLITKSSLLDLKLQEGSEVYISFKATAVHNF